MKLRVLRSAQARLDLIAHFAFIARDNIDAAYRFRHAYAAAAARLSEFPELGVGRFLRRARQSVRMWSIEGFEKYILVYQVQGRTIRILRVMHSSQDYTQL